jgi:hypothetical protein
MQFSINRYSLKKELISKGLLIIKDGGQLTILSYHDSMIAESAEALYHPLTALENLRILLEEKHGSLINCMGCRIDTAFRASGGYGSYIISLDHSRPVRESDSINIFEPTDNISKLCTVSEHILAYDKWCNH